MNRARRKEIARAQALIDEAKSILETVEGEERDAFDNLPDSLQQGERGQAIETAADAVQEVIDALEDASNQAGEVVGQ